MATPRNTGKTQAKLIKPVRAPSFWQRFRSNFLTGLVVVAPIGITLYLTWNMIDYVDAQVMPLVPLRYHPETYLPFSVPGVGLIFFVVFTAIIGSLTKNLFGRKLLNIGERWVDRMPIIRSIYNALKQIAQTILSQSKTSFKQACLVEYPRKGLWAVAFVSTNTRGEVVERIGNGQMMSIFLPTTPNPTSGFLLFVPRKDVILLDMTVEEAAKLVISAGLVTPPTKEERDADNAANRAQTAPKKPATR